jgi:hypothetical protein
MPEREFAGDGVATPAEGGDNEADIGRGLQERSSRLSAIAVRRFVRGNSLSAADLSRKKPNLL